MKLEVLCSKIPGRYERKTFDTEIQVELNTAILFLTWQKDRFTSDLKQELLIVVSFILWITGDEADWYTESMREGIIPSRPDRQPCNSLGRYIFCIFDRLSHDRWQCNKNCKESIIPVHPFQCIHVFSNGSSWHQLHALISVKIFYLLRREFLCRKIGYDVFIPVLYDLKTKNTMQYVIFFSPFGST